MAALHIVSNGPGAGKTALAGAIARRHCAGGGKAAYYKPFSAGLNTGPNTDPDVAYLGRLLQDLGSPKSEAPAPFPQTLNPEGRPAGLSEAQAGAVAETISALEADFDLVVVEWNGPTIPTIPTVPESPAIPAGQPTLLVYSAGGGADAATELNSVVALGKAGGENLAGIVINNVPRYRRREMGENMIAALQQRGLPVLGAIPEDREMLALTLGQVADYLGGEWVAEPADPDLWIDRFLIGGNIMDSGPNYFGRYANQAVITRAARPDIQLASLMCDTRFLVLTGGEPPTEYIRVEAQKRGASLLLAPSGTLETADALGGLLEKAHPYGAHKLARFTELAEGCLEGGLDGILARCQAGADTGRDAG